MNFLFPMAAWLGFLALPIIAFYLLKTRQRRKPVSTLLFWNELKPKIESSPFWRRLRRWLSLALALLIFGLILAALARPAFEWEKRAPRHIVALLDNSASMRATQPAPSRWEQAKAALERTIAQLRVQDEMTILTTEDPPRILHGWTSSQRALREAVAGAPLLETGSDPRAALALARELRQLRPEASIVIFSDAVWPAGAEEALPEGDVLRGIDPGNPVNTGITLFALRRSPVAPGDWQLEAGITASAPFTGTLELLRDGVPMDRVPVEASPEKPWRKHWRGSNEGAARFTAHLRTADLLAADDQAEARLEGLRPLRVLLVGAADPFLEAVLDSVPLVQWSREETFPEPLAGNPDLVITRGETAPAAPPANAALLLLNPQGNGFWGETTGVLRDVAVAEVDASARLLRHTGFGAVAIGEAQAWRPAPGSTVLVSGMEGPLIFGRWDRSPRWLAFGFDPGTSDLMYRTAFPVLIGNLLQSLRPDETADATARLPGPVESALQPAAPAPEEEGGAAIPWWPVFPGWWWALLLAAGLLVLEWGTYHRRITD